MKAASRPGSNGVAATAAAVSWPATATTRVAGPSPVSRCRAARSGAISVPGSTRGPRKWPGRPRRASTSGAQARARWIDDLRGRGDGEIGDALAGEEIIDQIGSEQERGGAVLQPRLRPPFGEKLGERVDLDGHRAGAAIELRLRDQGVNGVVDAPGARIAHVAHRREQRAGGVDIGVVDPVAVDADQRRRRPDARAGAAQADEHLVVDAQNVPVPGVADPHRAVGETVQLLGVEAARLEPSEIGPPARTAEIEHDQIRTVPALGHLRAPRRTVSSKSAVLALKSPRNKVISTEASLSARMRPRRPSSSRFRRARRELRP